MSMCAALGQYACYEPQRVSIRIMMLFLFLYGLVMSSSFNSFLISILTQPRFKQQIDNLNLAIEKNVRFSGGEVVRIVLACHSFFSHPIDKSCLTFYFPGSFALHGKRCGWNFICLFLFLRTHYRWVECFILQVASAVRNHFELCEIPDECLTKLTTDTVLAVAVSRLHAFNSPIISRSDIFCFPRSRNIYSYSVAMPIKFDFQLLPQINYMIRLLLEFGLIERWNQLSQSIAASAEIKRILETANRSGDDGTVVLTVAHIMGKLCRE